MLMMHGQANIR